MTSKEIPLHEELGELKPIYLPPNVSLTILFAPHMGREDVGDFSEFRRKVRRSDIFIPESIGWNLDVARNYAEVSKGNKSVYQALQKQIQEQIATRQNPSDFSLALFEALYASNRKIALIDIPASHELVPQILRPIAGKDLYAGSFEEGSSNYSKFMQEMTLAQVHRDQYMLEAIGPTLDIALNRNPKLKSKSKVDVFMTLGSLHVPFYVNLDSAIEKQRQKDSSQLPSVAMSESTENYLDQSSILANHYHPGLDFSLENQDLKRAEAEALTVHTLHWLRQDHTPRKNICMAVSSLSMSEMADIFNFFHDIFHGIDASEPDALNRFEILLEEIGSEMSKKKKNF